MIIKRVRVQLLGLLLVTVLGVGWVGFRYAGFGAASYPVHVQLADSGGIFTGADVTYRGVSVGRVGPLTLTASGVDVQLADQRGEVGQQRPHLRLVAREGVVQLGGDRPDLRHATAVEQHR